MKGRVNRLKALDYPNPVAHDILPTCPLCERVIPKSEQDAHHLIPKSKGGRETQYLHRICHRQVHALLKETELARTYNTAQALLQHPQIQAFVKWVQTKPPEFFEKSRKSTRLKATD